MRGLFVTAVLIAVGVVVVADDNVCLSDKNQFTYADGLTVAVDHVLGLVGQKYELDNTRWVADLKTNQNNLFHIKEEGSVTTCISYRTNSRSPYPQCVSKSEKSGKYIKFINRDLEYILYADSNPSKVVARTLKINHTPVTKWNDTITNKKLLEIPTECKK